MKKRHQAIQLPHFQFWKLPWKGFCAGWFLLFFFLGILTANWVGKSKMLEYGILNPYYVGQLAYAELDTGAYFLFLFQKRMKVFGLTALFVFTRFGIFALTGVTGWYFYLYFRRLSVTVRRILDLGRFYLGVIRNLRCRWGYKSYGRIRVCICCCRQCCA